MSTPLPGARFKVALNEEKPLHIIGAINANHALLAKRAGYRTNLARIFDSPTQEKILALSLGYEALTTTPVDEFMDLMAL